MNRHILNKTSSLLVKPWIKPVILNQYVLKRRTDLNILTAQIVEVRCNEITISDKYNTIYGIINYSLLTSKIGYILNSSQIIGNIINISDYKVIIKNNIYYIEIIKLDYFKFSPEIIGNPQPIMDDKIVKATIKLNTPIEYDDNIIIRNLNKESLYKYPNSDILLRNLCVVYKTNKTLSSTVDTLCTYCKNLKKKQEVISKVKNEILDEKCNKSKQKLEKYQNKIKKAKLKYKKMLKLLNSLK